jgi:sugar phosphate isomerase/epimerase
MRQDLICSSHTISGVMPGGPLPARHDFEARVAACAAAGYSGMCLHFRDYRALHDTGHSDAELRAILRQYGIAEISLEFLTGWFLDGAEAEQPRLDEETAYAAARAYGARCLNVGSDFGDRGLSRHYMRGKFRALCERAAANGVDIALEIVPWSDVPDIGSALEVIDGIDNAGLVIDAWHVFRGGIPLSDLASLPADRIFCIQVNDAEAAVRGSLPEDTQRRRPCGEGVFDLDGFVDSLERAGAGVPLSVEIISPDMASLDVDEAARRSIAGARALLARRQLATG